MGKLRHRVGNGDGPSISAKLATGLFGAPRNLKEKGLFHKLSLVPFLAWVGLGADGLSSSSYGPMESFLALGPHRYLAVALAIATAFTILVIAVAYSRIIERFPHGGGGYVVASSLLGRRVGVVSGAALLVDYVLTVTVSIAAAGDALFSLLPAGLCGAKVPVEIFLILALVVLNLRGVRESVMALVPIFLLFVATHLALIVGSVAEHVADLPATAAHIAAESSEGLGALGWVGMLALFARAWSLGGGTYTGIEAVSNGLPVLREPRVRTARRTMAYMAASLAFTAAGLLAGYLLTGIGPVEGKTLNAVLAECVFGASAAGVVAVFATLVSEGALLVVGAQAGFLDGPRVLSNMAQDGWVPRRYSSVSSRLTARSGILLMGGAALAVLLAARGDVSKLVIMYSINVFLTFSLSMAGMLRTSVFPPAGTLRSVGRILLFGTGLLLCGTILVVTSAEKFLDGAWLTLLTTAAIVGLCFLIQAHYRSVAERIARLDQDVASQEVPEEHRRPRLDPSQRTAVILVGAWGGLGIQTVLTIHKRFKGLYRNMVFVSAGVVDSASLKDEEELNRLRARTGETVNRYAELGNRLGLATAVRFSVGTDAVDELEGHCRALTHTFSDMTCFAGQLVFHKERWFHRFLHNETAFEVQKRLQQLGLTTVIVPTLVAAQPARPWHLPFART